MSEPLALSDSPDVMELYRTTAAHLLQNAPDLGDQTTRAVVNAAVMVLVLALISSYLRCPKPDI